MDRRAGSSRELEHTSASLLPQNGRMAEQGRWALRSAKLARFAIGGQKLVVPGNPHFAIAALAAERTYKRKSWHGVIDTSKTDRSTTEVDHTQRWFAHIRASPSVTTGRSRRRAHLSAGGVVGWYESVRQAWTDACAGVVRPNNCKAGKVGFPRYELVAARSAHSVASLITRPSLGRGPQQSK